jgi:hypothetical protein
MKLIKYIAVSLLLLVTIDIYACAPYRAEAGEVLLYRIMPLDETDYSRYDKLIDCDFYLQLGLPVNYEDEMTGLWKTQTSKDILSDDVKFVVFKAEVNYRNYSAITQTR